MTLKLTPTLLAAAYDYINATEPFRRWNLPDSEDVKFHVTRSTQTRGLYWRTSRPKQHHIAISSGCIARTDSLMVTMSHEMIHLHEAANRACGRGEHSAAWHKWAALVCRIHGFDLKLF